MDIKYLYSLNAKSRIFFKNIENTRHEKTTSLLMPIGIHCLFEFHEFYL